MNGLTKFFTSIFQEGERTLKVKSKILAYMNAKGSNSYEAIEAAKAKFSKYIYKRNGEYRKNGQEIESFIEWYQPVDWYR